MVINMNVLTLVCSVVVFYRQVHSGVHRFCFSRKKLDKHHHLLKVKIKTPPHLAEHREHVVVLPLCEGL